MVKLTARTILTLAEINGPVEQEAPIQPGLAAKAARIGTLWSVLCGPAGLMMLCSLDAGHPVFQVPQHEKDAVPEDVKRAARAMAAEAYRKRLEEINMSEHDAAVYGRVSLAVRKEVTALRAVLDSLQARAQERAWIKNQTTGDLDEGRLVESVAGERR
jgi:hypothetical protein